MSASSNSQTPVVIHGLRKSFGEQTVLDGIDLTVQHGESVAILGRSGTGKSVLLKLLIGLIAPDAGTIQLFGRDIAELKRAELNAVRTRIGFLFQQAALYDSLTIEENVAFPAARHRGMDEAKLRDHVHQLLKQVGMEEHAKKLPAQVSGGMQKRAGLARALALDPEMILFDEPTAGLDPITASEINSLIVKLQTERGVTALVVTHDLHGAKTMAKRLVMIHEGRILTQGSFEDLQRSKDEFVERFLREAA